MRCENKRFNVDVAQNLLEKHIRAFIHYNQTLIEISQNDEQVDKKTEKILKSCKSKQEVFDKVIELCSDVESPKANYYRALAYINSKACYRKNAIASIEKYLGSDLYEEKYKFSCHTYMGKKFTLEEEKNIHIAEMYAKLGNLYLAERKFDKALENYNKQQELTPFLPDSYCNIGNLYMIKNELENSLINFETAKNSRYYKPVKFKDENIDRNLIEDNFKRVIDERIIDNQTKIKNGYVYNKREKYKINKK